MAKFIEEQLETPEGAFGYLLAYQTGVKKQNPDELIESYKHNSAHSTGVNLAINYLKNLNAAIEHYSLLDKDSLYVLTIGFNQIFEQVLRNIENAVESVVYEILWDEAGKNNIVKYGSGSAWGNNKDTVVLLAQKLYEIQEIKSRWTAMTELMKSNRLHE